MELNNGIDRAIVAQSSTILSIQTKFKQIKTDGYIQSATQVAQ